MDRPALIPYGDLDHLSRLVSHGLRLTDDEPLKKAIDERNVSVYDCTHQSESDSVFGNPFPFLHY